MKRLTVGRDIRAIDGTLLLKAGSAMNKRALSRIRALARRRNWKMVAVGGTFLFKDFARVYRDKRYRIIFSSPGTKEDVSAVIKKAEIEKPLYLELRRMKKRDPYTYYHVLVVVALTVKMSITIKRPRFNNFIAAHLGFAHDLGKSRIPISILEKKTPFTIDEYRLMRSHPLIGHLLLTYYCKKDKRICCLSALEHHERLDGTGYPRGISAINKYSSLIAANDVLDALMTSRPYRRTRYTLRQALDFLVDKVRMEEMDKDTVYTLISYARKDKPKINALKISKRKRQPPPKDLVYGKISK
ncbi:HD-GYP domain-containing protein [Candidatus Omnitrophota bacterium]